MNWEGREWVHCTARHGCVLKGDVQLVIDIGVSLGLGDDLRGVGGFFCEPITSAGVSE